MKTIGNWTSSGVCVGLGPDLFFPERGETVEQAKALCATCSVREPCLEWGLHHEQRGVWGGTTGRERKAMRRELGIRLDAGNDFGGPVVEVTGHGTEAGYKHHRRAGEPACTLCKIAHAKTTHRNTEAA